jgi:hypothetical protein
LTTQQSRTSVGRSCSPPQYAHEIAIPATYRTEPAVAHMFGRVASECDRLSGRRRCGPPPRGFHR